MGFGVSVIVRVIRRDSYWCWLQILGKCEFLNPGGSVKDRVAVKIIEEVIGNAWSLHLILCLCDSVWKKSRFRRSIGVDFLRFSMVWIGGIGDRVVNVPAS